MAITDASRPWVQCDVGRVTDGQRGVASAAEIQQGDEGRLPMAQEANCKAAKLANITRESFYTVVGWPKRADWLGGAQ